MKRMEAIITAYWEVGTALRHPTAPAVSTERALKLLNQSDRLLPNAAEVNLSANMHTLRYDIIEGNTEWREKHVVQGSALILPIRR